MKLLYRADTGPTCVNIDDNILEWLKQSGIFEIIKNSAAWEHKWGVIIDHETLYSLWGSAYKVLRSKTAPDNRDHLKIIKEEEDEFHAMIEPKSKLGTTALTFGNDICDCKLCSMVMTDEQIKDVAAVKPEITMGDPHRGENIMHIFYQLNIMEEMLKQAKLDMESEQELNQVYEDNKELITDPPILSNEN